jgi:hypothetical protein
MDFGESFGVFSQLWGRETEILKSWEADEAEVRFARKLQL